MTQRRRSTIFISDLVLCIEQMSVQDLQMARLLEELLLLRSGSQHPPPSSSEPFATADDQRRPNLDHPVSPSAQMPPELKPNEIEEGDSATESLTQVTLTEVAPSDEEETEWLASTSALPKDTRLPSEPDVVPLFAPEWIPSILLSALSIPVPGSEVDLGKACEALATRTPITSLDYHPTWSTRAGVHLILDRSEGNISFLYDQEDLLKRVIRVVGTDRVKYTLLREPPAPDQSTSEHLLERLASEVSPAKVVLVVTDLGITRQVSFSPVEPSFGEWTSLSSTLRSRDLSVLFLVPYGPARWPQKLADALAIIPWDRATTASQARMAAKGATRG